MKISCLHRPSFWWGVIFCAVFFSGCSSSNEAVQEEKKDSSTVIINPNGDSELALRMRKIFDQTESIKNSMEGDALVIPADYIENLRSFHTDIPTDPDVKVTEFFGFVKAIDLAAVKLEKSSGADEQKENYSRLVNTCVQCHQQFCPGPIRRIKKLRLPKTQ